MDAHNTYCIQSQTPDLSTRPVANVFSMMNILCFNVFAHNIPSVPGASWRPHVLAAPFFEMRKFLPEYSACPAFQSFSDKTERILWTIFEEYMDMVRIYCDLYYLYIQFFACFAEYALSYHCDISGQDLSPVFWGEHHVIHQQQNLPSRSSIFWRFIPSIKVFSQGKIFVHRFLLIG